MNLYPDFNLIPPPARKKLKFKSLHSRSGASSHAATQNHSRAQAQPTPGAFPAQTFKAEDGV